MDKLLAVIEREFGERVRSKWFILTTLFGPLLFAALIVIPPWLAVRSQMNVNVGRVLFVDATGTELGNNVAVDVSGGLQGTSTPPRVLATTDATKANVVDSLRKELIAGNLLGRDHNPARIAGPATPGLPCFDSTSPIELQCSNSPPTPPIATPCTSGSDDPSGRPSPPPC